MSVEEAREELELEAERTFCGRGTEHHPHQLDAWLYRGDRLVLEVQADQLCYTTYWHVSDKVVPNDCGKCPPCLARAELAKVPA